LGVFFLFLIERKFFFLSNQAFMFFSLGATVVGPKAEVVWICQEELSKPSQQKRAKALREDHPEDRKRSAGFRT
jgi:hypothetical protein